MSIDTLIQEDLLNFRRELLTSFKEQHPHIFSIMDHMLSGRKNMVGLQVTEGGNIVGTYTLMMDGVHVVEAKSGTLDSALHHPLLGVVKPYIVIERNAIETLVKDDQIKTEIFSSIAKYLPDVTIKFLR
ncbi:hypothetical protein [Pelosinus sp. UFO1]|uniref:hypothetical protein n=1 Tax=Pelosinus sp. UFO1 TaxID=484770 RepID=UPI0004D0DBE9|nr:hypothetical protein [Pelosinus sp. UFO1]AIF52524.1 hypothetical protein UFO1_2981 [Pelosinus sp. UFO1]